MRENKDVIGGIVSSAVLLDLTISVWVGRKKDKTNTEKVVADSNAMSKDAALVTKRLFVDNPKLDSINKQANLIRNYLPTVTLPWMGNLKMLPISLLNEVMGELNDMKDEFDSRVKDFIQDYNTQVSGMAFKLGTMFDRSEYPHAREIADKFNVSWDIAPVPTSGDFRVDAENSLREELREAYEKTLSAKVEEVNTLLWERLKSCLDKLAERLGSDGDGKPNVFRDSLVENAVELCTMLKSLNVTGDSNLEKARLRLEDVMRGVTPKDLRESDEVRASVREDVKAMLGKFAF